MTTIAGAGKRWALLRDPDRAGVFVSTLCAIHCFGTALLVGASGVGALFADERLEIAFVASALTLALTALVRGARRHRSWVPASLGSVGIALLAIARSVRLEVVAVETFLSVSGGLLLVGAHLLNIRALHRVGNCCEGRNRS